MSWSVSAIGKPEAVAKKLADDFSRIIYLDGAEAAIKGKISEIVATALDAMSGVVVKVNASGSGSAYTVGDRTVKSQQVNVSIETVGPFLE